MKKLLVLSLVLGMATLASATLEISMTANKTNLTVGEVATITVTGPAANWGGYIIVEDNGSIGALSSPADLQGVNLFSYSDYEEAGWGFGYEITYADSTVGGIAAGPQWTILFSSDVEGTATVSLWDGAGTFEAPEGGVLSFVVTPEPMTMALLGLGGLFLRRRK